MNNFDHTDYSFVVKNRASPPKPWRWEIYRAGRTSPVKWSPVYFETMAMAHKGGKAALEHLLDDLYPAHRKHLQAATEVEVLRASGCQHHVKGALASRTF